MPWALSVPLLPEESLSSWLVRAALRQGCDPLSLTGATWPTWRIWTRDIDREIPIERMHPLVKVSGISCAEFKKAGMRDDCEKVAGYPIPGTRTWPWLLALGSRNRTRHGGQQVCTLCLGEDSTPYLRRQWRFAWHTGCRFHGVQLIDECPVCKAPIEPHRLSAEDQHLAQCSRCHNDFRKAVCTSPSPEAFRFQVMADHVFEQYTVTFRQASITPADWFSMMAFFMTVIRRAGRRPASPMANALLSLGISVTDCRMPVSGLAFELLPVSERCALLAAVECLLSIGLEETFSALVACNVKTSALHDPRKSPPVMLLPLLSRLSHHPHGPHRRRALPAHRPMSERAVRASWARLKRRMKAEPSS
ncbi:TniQ family protein [Vreelandella titanicae]|uniref:TniQ family protein n=1 Tax=Vreelandella titanicae TaxID=664683 RepID=UPI001592B9DA|nr:TniQ family protein [Halomonas titanicae]